jgi:hypothetical protein
MLQQAQIGNPSTVDQQHGDEQEGGTNDREVGFQPSAMKTIPQSSGQVESDQKWANEFPIAERGELLIFAPETAGSVDAAS